MRGLYVILTKGSDFWKHDYQRKGFVPLGLVNCGQVTGEYVIDKGGLVRFAVQAHLLLSLLFLARREHL